MINISVDEPPVNLCDYHKMNFDILFNNYNNFFDVFLYIRIYFAIMNCF